MSIDSTATAPPILDVKTKSGTENTSGEHTIVAAVTGKKIKVIAYKLTSKSATENLVTWLDGSGGTEVYRQRVTGDGTLCFGEVNNCPPPGRLFETTANTALIMNLSAAQAVDYTIAYIEEA